MNEWTEMLFPTDLSAESDRAFEHAPENRQIDVRVINIKLPRRTDQQLSRPARLNVESH